MGTLSKTDILVHLKAGNAVIDPFNEENLGNTSYDVRLGKYYYPQGAVSKNTQTINPFYKKSAEILYPELKEAIPVKNLKSKINPFHNLKDNDLVITVAPGETVLAHTIEFIGGKNGTEDLLALTTSMRARSTLGRLGIAVCKCAGWGDIGFVNRWTMEITNFSTSALPLVVGMRIAQIVFKEVTPVGTKDEYQKRGKYQKSSDLKTIKKNWKPEDMLPRLYADPDIGSFRKYYKD